MSKFLFYNLLTIKFTFYLFICNTNISHNAIILTHFNQDSLYFYVLSVLLLHIFDTEEWKTTGKTGGRKMAGVAVCESRRDL